MTVVGTVDRGSLDHLDAGPVLVVAVGGVPASGGPTCSGAISTSTDGRQWSAPIAVQDHLVDVAYGDGSWLALGSVTSAGGTGGTADGSFDLVTYRSTDGTDWQHAATTVGGERPVRVVGLHRSRQPVLYRRRGWLGVGSAGGWTGFGPRSIHTSADLVSWSPLGSGPEGGVTDVIEVGAGTARDATACGTPAVVKAPASTAPAGGGSGCPLDEATADGTPTVASPPTSRWARTRRRCARRSASTAVPTRSGWTTPRTPTGGSPAGDRPFGPGTRPHRATRTILTGRPGRTIVGPGM